MAYNHIPEELIERARAVSVLEYFETYKPGDLHWYGKCFRSREHPSFCVMQGGYVFDWKSQGITGYGALDYLKKCEGYDLNKQEDFRRAVEILTNTDIELVQSRVSKSNYAADRQPKLEFCLPEKAFSNSRAINYLRDRALSKEVINYCIQKGLIYQSKEYSGAVLIGYDDKKPLYISRKTYDEVTQMNDISDIKSYCMEHKLLLSKEELSNLKIVSNVVFVGYNSENEPAYAFKRGMYNKTIVDENGKEKNKSFRQEVIGSNKKYAFAMYDEQGKSKAVHLFEAAIDALSYATLIHLYSGNYRTKNLLSLGGAQSGKSDKSNAENVTLPLALEEFLKTYPQKINKVYIHFDNDEAGIKHAKALQEHLTLRGIESEIKLPPSGKDVNDFLKVSLEKAERELQTPVKNVLSRG